MQAVCWKQNVCFAKQVSTYIVAHGPVASLLSIPELGKLSADQKPNQQGIVFPLNSPYHKQFSQAFLCCWAMGSASLSRNNQYVNPISPFTNNLLFKMTPLLIRTFCTILSILWVFLPKHQAIFCSFFHLLAGQAKYQGMFLSHGLPWSKCFKTLCSLFSGSHSRGLFGHFHAQPKPGVQM